MNDLSTIPVMVDEQYNSALQFGEYFTQLYLLGPHCLRLALDKISQAENPEMAIQAWIKLHRLSGWKRTRLPYQSRIPALR